MQDERAVAVNMGSFEDAKRNYNVIKDGLSADFEVKKFTEKPMIKSLRPSSGDRTDVVFADNVMPIRRCFTLASEVELDRQDVKRRLCRRLRGRKRLRDGIAHRDGSHLIQ